MPASGIIIVLVVGCIAAAWWFNLGAREIAIATAKRLCSARGILLLDDTVSFHRYGLGRDHLGRRRLRRVYDFEFSAPDQERGNGSIAMLGDRVLMVEIRRADGRREFERIGD